MSIVCIVFCSSCYSKKEKTGSFINMDPLQHMQIANQSLKEAIIDYQEKIFHDNSKRRKNGDSVYVCVCSRMIGDSLSRFVLFPIVSPYGLKFEIPFIVYQIRGHAVFFTSASTHPNYHLKNPFFTLPDSCYISLIKQYFPKDTLSVRNRDTYIYEPENCYLTFMYDSLIGKKYQHGSWLEKVLVEIDNKSIYL